MKNVNNLFCKADAVFSPDRVYRYLLTRTWDEALPAINFIMLNPSTADENVNDPTVERCQQRAHMWGFGRLIVTNLFAVRSTDPSKLFSVDFPVGQENDMFILRAAQESKTIVCAWGSFVCRLKGQKKDRPRDVVDLLKDRELTALKIAKTKEPLHPLYVNYDIKPTIWRPYEEA